MSSRLNADIIAGLFFVLIGTCFLVGSFDLPYGTFRRIGPGAFPALVAVGLIAMGITVFVSGRRSTAKIAPAHVHIQKVFVIIASIIVFGLVIRGGGLLPAVLCCSFVAALASRPFQFTKMAFYGFALGAICSLVFIKGLGMPVSMIGPWFSSWFGL
jgi:putative tricarboxylic transport membrane protein